MIKFTWKPYTSERGIKYIDWKAQWDGKHDDDWYNVTGYEFFNIHHPFSRTLDYLDMNELYISSKLEEDNPNSLIEVGDVVADNSVTRAMCEILANPKKSLLEEKASGNTDEYWYYTNLIGCLSRLWD